MAVPVSPQVKATWIWDPTLIAEESDSILNYAKQNRINLIYLQIEPSLSQSSYQAFIKAASALEIRIDALSGDPRWALPAERSGMTDFVSWVKTYNGSVSAEERFQGVHLDMEPYSLDEWNTDRGTVVRYWMEAVSVYTAAVHELSLPAGADLPLWLDGIRTSDAAEAPSLSEWMIRRLDQATIMAYRDKAESTNGIVAASANEIEAADRLGKTIVVAVDTLRSSEADFVSFYEEGRAVLDAELRIVADTLKDHRSFAGVAVHDYVGWRALRD